MTGEQEKKRAWLCRARTAEKYVQALKEEALQYMEFAETLLLFDNSDFVKLVQKLERSMQERQKKIKELSIIRENIKKSISQMPDDRLKEILARHYLTYETIESVAESMNYDRRTIQKKHLKALDKIMMPKESEMKL